MKMTNQEELEEILKQFNTVVYDQKLKDSFLSAILAWGETQRVKGVDQGIDVTCSRVMSHGFKQWMLGKADIVDKPPHQLTE